MNDVVRPQYHFRKIGADLHIWDVRKLLDLARGLPVQDVLLSDIEEIDEPYWFGDPDIVPPTCRAIMAHAEQVAGTDLSYPILLCPNGRIMDGMHRVMKAVGAGHATIKARRLQTLPPPDHLNKHPDDLDYS